MRIAVGGIHVECSTYNPVLTRERDFTVLRGGEPAAPYFAFLRDYPARFLLTIHAWAIAGGPVAAPVTDPEGRAAGRARRRHPLDGVYLAMHGAMVVEGMEDAEGD